MSFPRVILALALVLGGCRFFVTAEEIVPGGSFEPERRPEVVPALLELYLDPASLPLLEEGSYALRLVHLDARGKEDDAQYVEVAPGYRLLLLAPGRWQVLQICRKPCRGYVVRPKRGDFFQLERGYVNYLGAFLVTLYPAEEGQDPEYQLQGFFAAGEALAKGWPGVREPLREAR
jgi:hypothetical protein